MFKKLLLKIARKINTKYGVPVEWKGTFNYENRQWVILKTVETTEDGCHRVLEIEAYSTSSN